MTLAQLAKDAYPVSILFHGRLSKAQRDELEKTCDVHAMSVYMNGSARYSIRYKPGSERKEVTE